MSGSVQIASGNVRIIEIPIIAEMGFLSMIPLIKTIMESMVPNGMHPFRLQDTIKASFPLSFRAGVNHSVPNKEEQRPNRILLRVE